MWKPRIFRQQEDQDNGFTFFYAGGLRRVRRFLNRHGGTLRKAGWVTFTETYSREKWLISHLPPTVCDNHSHQASPSSLFLTSPRPRPTRPRIPYLMSSSPPSRVPKSQVPTHASRCPRPTFMHSRCHKNLFSLKFSIGSYYFYKNEGRDDNTEKKFSVGFSQ